MKTSVDIYDALYEEVRALFPNMTIKQIIDRSLRALLDMHRVNVRPKRRLKKAIVAGRGLQDGIEWSALRDLAYERE